MTKFTATGLPPGIRVGIDNSGETSNEEAALIGKPTQAGSYTVTITGTAPYNNATQTNTASTEFTWTIVPTPPPPPPPLPKIPIFLGPASHNNLQIRPVRITYTGDGTGFFAGPGHASHKPRIGHLRWSRWTATGASGSGYDWDDNCTPACANGLRTPYHVLLALSRPGKLGGHLVFTRLQVSYTGRRPKYEKRQSFTFKLSYYRGSFSW